MRVAWFTHRYHPCIGGAETYGRAMVRRLVEEGHRVDVFTSDAHDLWYFTDRNRRRVEAPAESIVDGARVHRLAVRHIPFQKYVGRLLSYVPHWPTQCRFESYLPIIPGLERIRGDYGAVFAVGFPFTGFAYAACRTARAAGAPLILTPFLHLATPGDAVNRHYTRPHQVRLLAEADLVVTPTRLEAQAVASWGIDPDRLLTLPMAIEREDVTGGNGDRLRSRLGIPQGQPVVGQLGALDPNKGTPDLVRAIALLNADRPADQAIQLLLAGAPSPAFESFLVDFPDSQADWLKVLGPLPKADVPDFYALIDLFAMPSRTDSFGIVYLEAWANAKPVLAAEAGGVVEVVRHEKNGLLVPFGDVGQIASSIARLLDDRSLAARLGASGQAQALCQDATWDARFKTLWGRVAGLKPKFDGPTTKQHHSVGRKPPRHQGRRVTRMG